LICSHNLYQATNDQLSIPTIPIDRIFIVVKMQSSVILSAVSVDSPRGLDQEGWVRESELTMEVERLLRRNSLLDKSKQVL
jgi:hypothetical protein